MKVICPQHIKTIRMDADWRAEVTVRQTLVFLDEAARGCLHDKCVIGPGADLDTFIWRSEDGIEIGRKMSGREAVVIDWRPRDPVVPYAMYEHEYSWRPTGSHASPALFTEVQCELKTGWFQFAIEAADEFETGVVFERPRWRALNTERKLVKYALKLLDMPGDRLLVADGSRRVEWRVSGPKPGTRFIVAAFRRHGVAMWQERLRSTSLAGRARQLIGRPLST